MLFFLLKILVAIIIGFLTINLALFIWRVITPFARMYYRDPSKRKSYFGYVRKTTSSDDSKIIDAGRIIGNKEIGLATKDGKIELSKNNEYLGYVNTRGEIFDKNNNLVAKCNPNGSRTWKDLWLMHRTEVEFVNNSATQNTGYCTVSLKFGSSKTSQVTLLAKAAAALALLEDYIILEEGQRLETGTGAKDLAFPAALLYVGLFSVISMLMMYYKMFPALGDMLSYVASMLVVYFLLWWTLYLIKTDFANRNVSFSMFLNLLNRNTGIIGWNFWLIIFAVAGLVSSILIHGYIFVPLFLVILIGTGVNFAYVSAAEWPVLQPGNNVWKPEKRESNREKVKTISPVQTTKTIVKRIFSWDLDTFNIVKDPKDICTVTMYKEDFEDPKPEMREKNPFFGTDATGNENWKTAIQDMDKSVKTVLDGSDILLTEKTEKNALLDIINSAYKICNTYNLADYELYELLLSFCQTGITYVLDENSKPIKKAGEYVRFASESLYDQQGDCDCKAALAFKLFEQLGVEVKFAIVTIKNDGGRHAAILVKKDTGNVKLPNKFKVSIPNFPDFAYCEATDKGWAFGVIPEEVDIDSIVVI